MNSLLEQLELLHRELLIDVEHANSRNEHLRLALRISSVEAMIVEANKPWTT